MMNDIVHTLTIIFSNKIAQRDIPAFRGAIISTLPEKNVLFHNHLEEGFRYSYPLIQYKRIRGKAAIVGIDDGAKILNEIFTFDQISLKLRNKECLFSVEEKLTEVINTLYSNEMKSYHLHDWIPLNSENYEKYNSSESLAFRLGLLEKILLGNIISFFKGLGIHLDQQINVIINQLNSERIIKYKEIDLMSFDINFKTNLILPNHIGLGKSSSSGFGVLCRIN